MQQRKETESQRSSATRRVGENSIIPWRYGKNRREYLTINHERTQVVTSRDDGSSTAGDSSILWLRYVYE